MLVIRALTDVDVARADLDQPRHGVLLIVDRRRRQVEMDAVLLRLRLRNGQEKKDSQRRAIRRQELDTVIRLVADLPAQRLGPEPREPQRLVRVEAQCDEPRRHVVRHPVRTSIRPLLSAQVAIH